VGSRRPTSALALSTSSPKIPGQAADDVDDNINNLLLNIRKHDGRMVSIEFDEFVFFCNVSDFKLCDPMSVTNGGLAKVTRASHEDTKTRSYSTDADC
jgi:hypothetical protein